MASYDSYSTMSTPQGSDNLGFFNRILRGLSKYGMDFNDTRIKNTFSIGIHEDTQSLIYEPGTNMYDIFTKKVISRILDQKSIAYLDRSYYDKRKILRQYSIKDEVREVVKRIAGECIIFDENNNFCNAVDLPAEFSDTIRKRYQENFKRILNAYRLNDGLMAYEFMKTLLIDGHLAFEIVYDNKQKNIIDLSPIDPMTVIVATDPGSNSIVWIQNPDNPQIRRVLLDSQIVYISYSNSNEFNETSYVEGLIRPYNQLKMLEQAKLLYNINQASIYKRFIIPTNGLTRQQAEQQVYQLMSEYHEDVQWDDTTGQMTYNGSANIPHSKDFWFPSSEQGSPTVEIMKPESNDLNEDMMLRWFYNIFKRASQIPFTRWDSESGGGTIYQDASDITVDEIVFKDYIDRLRTTFKEIIVKSIRIQMILEFPELKDNVVFNSSIRVEFNKNGLFEEWKYLRNLEKRAGIASTLSGSLQDANGQPWFATEFLVKHIMKLTDEEIRENEAYKRSAAAEQGGGEPDGGGAPDFSGGGFEDFSGSGGPDFGGGTDFEDFGGQGGDTTPDFGGGPEIGGPQPGGQVGGGQVGGGQAPQPDFE